MFRIAGKAAIQRFVEDLWSGIVSARRDGRAGLDVPIANLRNGTYPAGHLSGEDEIEVR